MAAIEVPYLASLGGPAPAVENVCLTVCSAGGLQELECVRDVSWYLVLGSMVLPCKACVAVCLV